MLTFCFHRILPSKLACLRPIYPRSNKKVDIFHFKIFRKFSILRDLSYGWLNLRNFSCEFCAGNLDDSLPIGVSLRLFKTETLVDFKKSEMTKKWKNLVFGREEKFSLGFKHSRADWLRDDLTLEWVIFCQSGVL